MDLENVKKLVHDQYVLNYIMKKLEFWKMRVTLPAHKYNVYKIKLYKPYGRCDFSLSKSSLMTFNEKHEAHVHVENDWRFKNGLNKHMCFTIQQCDPDIILIKSLTLGILKKSGGFKWKDQCFLTDGVLDELLVKADLEESTKDFEEEDFIAARNAKSTLANDMPF